MRSIKAEGIVIKRRNIQEADRILTIFTKYQGKIQISAKGVRKITSRRGSHIELLNQVIIGLHQGRHLPILTEIETLQSFENIKNELDKVGLAYHICELVDGLLPEGQENTLIYDLLLTTLQKLEDETDNCLLLVHGFEVELLAMLGYWQKDVQSTSVGNLQYFIENILERRLRSRRIFAQVEK